MTQPASSTNTPDDDVRRLFIGITCTHLIKVAAALRDLRQIAAHRLPEIRVIPEANLHITLKFLGSAQGSSVGRIAATLDRLAAAMNPFVITLSGAGAFKDVLWLGVNPCDSLTRLASLINQQLQTLGFQPETREFIPHLTLARVKLNIGSELQTWLEQHQYENWGSVNVQEMHLYKSEMLNGGTRYSILHTSMFTPLD